MGNDERDKLKEHAQRLVPFKIEEALEGEALNVGSFFVLEDDGRIGEQAEQLVLLMVSSREKELSLIYPLRADTALDVGRRLIDLARGVTSISRVPKPGPRGGRGRA